MAKKLPAFQFYPGDWMKDPSVRSLSLEARGLWIDLICLMFEAEPRGYLTLNGRPMTTEEIARATGQTCDNVRTIVGQLRDSGTVSTDEKGRIFCRRLVRDQKKRDSDRDRKRLSRICPSLVTPLSQPCPEDEDEERTSTGISGREGGGPGGGEDPISPAARYAVDSSAVESVWDAIPPARRRKRPVTLRAVRNALVRLQSENDPDPVLTLRTALGAYYGSPEGSGEFHRQPHTWLDDLGWTEPPSAWESRHGPGTSNGRAGSNPLQAAEERRADKARRMYGRGTDEIPILRPLSPPPS